MIKFVDLFVRGTKTLTDGDGVEHKVINLDLETDDGVRHHIFNIENLESKTAFEKLAFIEDDIWSEGTTLTLDDRTGDLTFNNHDIKTEGQWIADAYVNQDFYAMGFILANTLVRNCQRQIEQDADNAKWA